jgi:hypothetical protein
MEAPAPDMLQYVHCEIKAKPTNALYGQNAEFYYDKAAGVYMTT